MAKAIANCTCKSCGKEFEYITYRNNSREARRFEEWAEQNIDECPECKEKREARERAEAISNAKTEAAERGWPELVGTDKQVNWAVTIRHEIIAALLGRYSVPSKYAPDIDPAIRYFLSQKTNASWWIDNRDERVDRMIIDLAKHPEKMEIQKTLQQTEMAARDDAVTIAEPEHRIHDGIVEINVAEKKVSAAYRKDDDFRSLLKGLGYRWSSPNNYWYMEIGLKTGTAAERAAELGNKLLNAGFSIRIHDPETLRNAINGNYEPMTYRWISATDGNSLFVTWSRDDSFYDQAKRLPGARYVSPGIQVPCREYEAVLDFAHTYDFRLTPGAQTLVDEMRQTSSIVTPGVTKNPLYQEHPLSDVLDTSRDIIEDLKD